MRNPIRFKNLNPRLAPFYLLGLALLWLAHPSWASVSGGLAGLLGGLVLRAWGAGHLVKTDRLAVSGPYAYVRHPLYLGTLLIGVGFAGMLRGWVAAGALVALVTWFGLAYFPRKERTESARLLARYGEAYRTYRDQVPALRPRLRAWRPESGLAEELEPGLRWQFSRYDANNELGTLLACTLGVGLVALRVVAE